MICAEDEIGFGTSHEGIMVLDNNATVGTPAADYFKIEQDWVFEIGLTPIVLMLHLTSELQEIW